MSLALSARGWERIAIVGGIYLCLTVVASLGMIIFMHHIPQYQPVLLLSLAALVLFELSFASYRSRIFAPYLIVWLLWLVERVVLANYWLAVGAKLYPAVPLIQHQYPIAFSVQLLCSWLSVALPIARRGVGAVLLAVVFAAAVVAQWSPVQGEKETVLQAAAFAIMYLLAFVVTDRQRHTERGLARESVCIVQSAWCLWALNPLVLVVAAAVQGMASTVILASSMPRKAKGSESEYSDEEYSE